MYPFIEAHLIKRLNIEKGTVIRECFFMPPFLYLSNQEFPFFFVIFREYEIWYHVNVTILYCNFGSLFNKVICLIWAKLCFSDSLKDFRQRKIWELCFFYPRGTCNSFSLMQIDDSNNISQFHAFVVVLDEILHII